MYLPVSPHRRKVCLLNKRNAHTKILYWNTDISKRQSELQYRSISINNNTHTYNSHINNLLQRKSNNKHFLKSKVYDWRAKRKELPTTHGISPKKSLLKKEISQSQHK